MWFFYKIICFWRTMPPTPPAEKNNFLKHGKNKKNKVWTIKIFLWFCRKTAEKRDGQKADRKRKTRKLSESVRTKFLLPSDLQEDTALPFFGFPTRLTDELNVWQKNHFLFRKSAGRAESARPCFIKHWSNQPLKTPLPCTFGGVNWVENPKNSVFYRFFWYFGPYFAIS